MMRIMCLYVMDVICKYAAFLRKYMYICMYAYIYGRYALVHVHTLPFTHGIHPRTTTLDPKQNL